MPKLAADAVTHDCTPDRSPDDESGARRHREGRRPSIGEQQVDDETRRSRTSARPRGGGEV
jgi:hypothetical protein